MIGWDTPQWHLRVYILDSDVFENKISNRMTEKYTHHQILSNQFIIIIIRMMYTVPGILAGFTTVFFVYDLHQASILPIAFSLALFVYKDW